MNLGSIFEVGVRTCTINVSTLFSYAFSPRARPSALFFFISNFVTLVTIANQGYAKSMQGE